LIENGKKEGSKNIAKITPHQKLYSGPVKPLIVESAYQPLLM
jgi:hypothetical protein